MRTVDGLRTEQSTNTSHLIARILVVVVIGYWAFGKAFAYLGLYPLYIGEIVLVAGLLYLIHRGTVPIPNQLLFWLYSLFSLVVVGQALFSVLALGQAPVEVARNLAIAYYGVFAVITFALITRFAGTDFYRETLEVLLPRVAPWILIFSTVTVVGGIFFRLALPVFPRTDGVSVLFYKPTDAVMPLIVLMVLWMRGYLRTRWMIWTAGLLAIAMGRSRSAMMAVGIAVLAMIWRPTRRTLSMMSVALLVFVVLLITDARIDLGYREVSARQFLANFSSLVGSDEAASGLDATTARNKSWRADWWEAIYGDAVENDRYAIGLGWGTNLADEFGFQTEAGDINALRNPHNALLGILARGGWLAASLWATFYLVLIYGLWQASRIFQHDKYRQDMTWIILIYVIASQINGATDVFLESPQNAIPHWIVVGIGWALIRDAQQLAAGSGDRTTLTRSVTPPALALSGWRRGIGRPLSPALGAHLSNVRPCPYLSLESDNSTCAIFPRIDHVCERLDHSRIGTGWQADHCLGAFDSCPHWIARRSSVSLSNARNAAV